MDEEKGKVLHIVMFPWLAIGHLRPFFRLSVALARKGHRVSFISTPRNLERSVKVPPDLRHLIDIVSLPLPEVRDLPLEAESSMDVPHVKQQLLKVRDGVRGAFEDRLHSLNLNFFITSYSYIFKFACPQVLKFDFALLLKVANDLLEPSVNDFLEHAKPKPDWVVYDYATHWLPNIAGEIGISRAFFSPFTAAFMAFLGPPSVLMGQESMSRSTAEDYTVVPEWIPFPSDMAFRLHEMSKNMEKDAKGNVYDSGTSDSTRFGLAIAGSDIVIFRSCTEFEPEWFDLVRQLYRKPVIPVGVLHASDEFESTTHADWPKIKKFLDDQTDSSLLYVALGTEATLSQTEMHELALGLEQSGLPFLWVMNRDYNMLPHGFIERVRDKAMVYPSWAPQVEILGHLSVGGFLTHCGWNSATEALGFGKVLVLFPVMNDQGLNCRLLREKGVGLEIERNEIDGSFTAEEVAATVRMAVVGEEGRGVRENAKKMKEVFGDKGRMECYVDGLIHHMVQMN